MDFAQARANMVEQQIRPWDVLDARVLEIMGELPRERFVPEGREGLAYADTEIPLGQGEYMLAPKVIGRILQAVAPRPSDAVLEVGTGSGYLTACLARLSAHVDSVERIESFRAAAAVRVAGQSVENTDLHFATVTPDWTPPRERYDAIVLTGAMTEYDPFLQSRLNPGGRLFVVTGRPPVMQARLVLRVADESCRSENLFETLLKPLVGFEPSPAFVF